MRLRFVHYLFDIGNRIPLRECLGYHYTADICIMLALISNVCRFLFRPFPWVELLLVVLMYGSISVFAITCICSNKQSIINLLPECPKTKDRARWAIFVMYMLGMSFSCTSILLFAGGDSMALSVLFSCMVGVQMILYLGCQFYIIWCGDDVLEMAAAGMTTEDFC